MTISLQMKAYRYVWMIALVCLAGCNNEFNKVYKSTDYDYRYEYAKECFAQGKHSRVVSLLGDMITVKKGTDDAEEALYMLGMSQFLTHDFESASETMKKYTQSYPKGLFFEHAAFYVGQSLYQSAPEPRLDQTPTIGAINAYQTFLDQCPESELRGEAQSRLFELQDKLVQKELLSAQLYYNLGGYFGNCTNGGSNLEACIITSQNALKTYPYMKSREEFSLLIMKSKFELAEQSVEEKRVERYRDAEDECYGFVNEYPESKQRALAEKYIAKCKKIVKD